MEFEDAPPHEPGILPKWLTQEQLDIIVAGGMGGRAQNYLCQQGIDGAVGVEPGMPKREWENIWKVCLTQG